MTSAPQQDLNAGSYSVPGRSFPAAVSAADLRSNDRRPYAGHVTCPELDHCELAALDISPEGMGLLSPRPIAPGRRVTLLFPGGMAKVAGIVSRLRTTDARNWQLGISFLQQQPSLLHALQTAG